MASDITFWKKISESWNRLIDQNYRKKEKKMDDMVRLKEPTDKQMSDDLGGYDDDE